jgi:hypothetical protein
MLGVARTTRTWANECACIAQIARFITGLPNLDVQPVAPAIVYSQHAPMPGQPVHLTHPELLGPQEIAPGVTLEEYRLRRQRLAALLPPNTMAVLPAAATAYMTGVIPYPYRQVGPLLNLWQNQG